jgi:hypothetical protein
MNTMNYLESIGKLTFQYYEAEYERVKARIARSNARESHKCGGEMFNYEGDSQSCPCHQQPDLKFEDWCDDCKFVQPYWLAYRQAAEKARKAKYILSRKIKSLLAKGYHY